MTQLPIHEVLEPLKRALQKRHEVVLEAPPGAGKTTVVPLELLSESWLVGQKILMLEPRRLAARAAAERMAQTLGEKVGDTVGYRVRLDTKVGANTRIEVITEGILTRMLQNDPSLEGVGLVIFDEFHERSLDADLGLALTLQGRELFSDLRQQPLKLLVMSATLDGERISELLSKAPLVRSEGQSFPVDIIYGAAYQYRENTVDRVVDCVMQALADQSGSLLVFLPGQGEIRKTQQLLQQRLSGDQSILLAPLFGDLTLAEQRRAINPPESGVRKIVLATSIAESSLTIAGVRVVVDAGLSRQSQYDPNTGLSRLVTLRASKASTIQRAGRAGRTQSGVCYRLWSQTQQYELAEFTSPEITQADLSALALQLLQWGVSDPAELTWLNQPAAGAYQQGLELLQRLGAASRNDKQQWQITEQGSAMSQLPLSPRLSHMLVCAKPLGLADQACELAALLSERDFVRDGGGDLQLRLEILRAEKQSHRSQQGAVSRIKRQQQQLKHSLDRVVSKNAKSNSVDNPQCYEWTGLLLAFAYPDRIAQQRVKLSDEYRLSNGRAVNLGKGDRLNRCPWLVVADAGGQKDQSSHKVYLASSLKVDFFDGHLSSLVVVIPCVEWHEAEEKLVAEQQRKVGRLVIDSKPLNNLSSEQKQQALLALVRKRGLGMFNWTPELLQWRARIQLLHSLFAADQQNPWPNVSDDGLLASLESWLAPYVDKVTRLNHFKNLDLASQLQTLLPWPLPKQLDELAPLRIKVPSGSGASIDYSQSPPVLAVKLQEMFGCEHTPTIANGQIKLLVHLLSPARRPLQVTQDLSGFWRGSYQDVKKEMKGRYPRHPWPDDPLQAIATSKTKNKIAGK